MSLLSFFGCGRTKTPEYPTDTLTARDGTEFTLTFFQHASIGIRVGGHHIYIDPVGNFAGQPKADLILLTQIGRAHV